MRTMSTETVFIGIGSNLGNRQEYCDRALALMNLLPHSRVTGVSSYYETEPVDPKGCLGETWFYNGVVRIETQQSPEQLFAIVQETERSLGRDQANRSGARTIDLDMLFYGKHIRESPEFTIPHPRLHLRRFVLTPLVELDPTWFHPVLNKTAQELLEQLTDSCQIRKLDLVPGSLFNTRPTCSTPP